MTLTLELSPELELQLQQEAHRHGMPAPEYALRLIEDLLIPASSNNPLTAALDLSRELQPIIQAGTRGPVDAAADLDALREERLNDLSH